MRPRLLLSATFALFVCSRADHGLLHDYAGYQDGLYGSPPKQSYRSSDITSPIFNYNTWRKDLVAGNESSHLLLTLGVKDVGPYIFRDDDLSLVYADPRFDSAMNAQVQILDGERYLSFWHGVKNGGQGQGYCVFYNEHYELKYNLTLGSPLIVGADMHECQVAGPRSVLLTGYQDKIADLSALGGESDGVLADGCFQEVDIRDNSVLFSWCASDYFTPELTFWQYMSSNGAKRRVRGDDSVDGEMLSTSSGFDAYHINSLQKTNEGHYLVALRNLKSLTYVNGTSGKPIWSLGGKANDFTDVTPLTALSANPGSEGALGFGWQHTARFIDETLTVIDMFDNHNTSMSSNCTGPTCSRGRRIRIDTSNPRNLTVQLLHDYRSPHGLQSAIMGSMQTLPNNNVDGSTSTLSNVMIGWGDNAEITEYTSEGELVRDLQYSPLDPRHSHVTGPGWSSYRVLKQSWRGYPPWPPSIATDRKGTVWISWNGATEVHAWEVYGSESEAVLGSASGSAQPDGSSRRPLQVAKRSGFETEIVLGVRTPMFAKVAALDRHGSTLGLSDTVWLPGYSLGSTTGCSLPGALAFLCRG